METAASTAMHMVSKKLHQLRLTELPQTSSN